MQPPAASLLIVDDDADLRVLLKDFFVRHGYAADTARDGATMRAALAAAILLFAAGFGADLYGQRALSPTASSHAAAVAFFLSLEGFYGLAVIAMALFALARCAAGRLDRVRRAAFDSMMLLWHYAVAQSLAGLALVHGFPRLVG